MIFDTLYSFFAEHAISIILTLPIVAMDSGLLASFYRVVDLILSNATLVGLFIRPSTLVAVSVTVLAIINFEHLYRIALWVKRRFSPL